MKPDPRGKPEFTIADPACGTGGFLVCSYEWLVDQAKGVFDRADAKRIKTQTYYGQDLVPRPRRLALMNLFLHGVEPHIYLGDTIYEPFRGERNDVILTNPPFGTKGANQAPDRDDFTIETSNKQLNFVQHVLTALKPGGRAAMVLPDNCLFEGQGRRSVRDSDAGLQSAHRPAAAARHIHALQPGRESQRDFLSKRRPTEATWIFDARSNVPGITKKDRPLTPQHFAEFEKAYGADPNGRSKRDRRPNDSAVSTSTKSKNANTSSTSPGSKTNRSKTATNFPNRRTSPPRRSRNWKRGGRSQRDHRACGKGGSGRDMSLRRSDLSAVDLTKAEAITELEAVVDDLREIVDLVEKEELVEK